MFLQSRREVYLNNCVVGGGERKIGIVCDPGTPRVGCHRATLADLAILKSQLYTTLFHAHFNTYTILNTRAVHFIIRYLLQSFYGQQ